MHKKRLKSIMKMKGSDLALQTQKSLYNFNSNAYFVCIFNLYQCDLTFMPVKLNLTLVNADRTNK